MKRCRTTLIVAALISASASSACSSGSTQGPESGAAAPTTTSPSTSSSSSASTSSSSSPCARHDLDARYVGGGAGGQTLMGGIVIRNTGTRPCTLTGAVTFAAYWADGARDTLAATNGARPPLAATLPAAMPPYRDQRSDSNHYVYAQLAAPQFTATGTCTAPRGPRVLELGVGRVTFRVTNHDPHAPQNETLRGCGGRILLEHINKPDNG